MSLQTFAERTDGDRKHPLKLRMSLREGCALRKWGQENRRSQLLRKFDSLLPSAATFDLLTIDECRIFAVANSCSELRQSSGIWRKAVAVGLDSNQLRSRCRKSVTEHRGFTLGLLLSGFVLNDIPVLYETAVLHANDISRNPVHRCSEPGKAAVHDHEVSLCDNRAGFVL